MLRTCATAVLTAIAFSAASAAQQQRGPVPSDTNPVALTLAEVIVVGDAANAATIPGSANVLSLRALESSRPFTINEAVRKLPGVHARDEEGFGLRPNLGIRGLNPTRTTKVTLLEDGVPLAYAPYGDNASYYHPPIDRFERIELLKGAGQILFGPQTIGGVINYLTPPTSERLGGFVSLTSGSRSYMDGKVRLRGHRMMLDYTRRQGDGARDNISSAVNDINFKAVALPGSRQALTFRANAFTEHSNVTYSGLTQAEFENFGARYNPFRNDFFDTMRAGASVTHRIDLGANAFVTTNLYASYFGRDWWRQSSTTTDTQGGAAGVALRDDRLAGKPIDPDNLNSIQGRLRDYTTRGVEPRLTLRHALLGVSSELLAGVRAHFENQDRRQENGTSPTARSGTLVEDNLRRTAAYSAFVANRFIAGAWSVMPGLRLERIGSTRANRLPGGVAGSDDLQEWIPSLGVTWSPRSALTVFGGVHRGFAPPRTEDVIAMVGTSTEVQAERSANWELGVRHQPSSSSLFQATLFENDFDRLIAVGSIAGGATPLAQGRALFRGVELSGQHGLRNGMYVGGAYTWLPDAEQTTAFQQVVGGAAVTGSVPGNRQPYAPRHLLSATIGYAAHGFDGQVEMVHVGEQFADFANTVAPSADGQRGLIAASTVYNAALNYRLAAARTTMFIALKNLTNRTYIVDRTRGIQVASPRLVHAGTRYAF